MSFVGVPAVSGVTRIVNVVDDAAFAGTQHPFEGLNTPIALPSDDEGNRQGNDADPTVACGDAYRSDNDSDCNDNVGYPSHAR
jgi:hypothetical protein